MRECKNGVKECKLSKRVGRGVGRVNKECGSVCVKLGCESGVRVG